MRNYFLPISLALLCAATARADQKLIRLTTFPTVALADGKSQVTVSAELRDTGGRIVADGTRVVLSSPLGTFRESVVVTSGGLARGTLIAGGIPGLAKITATVLGESANPTVIELEFVADRKLLASAEESVEIFAGESLEFTYDTRLVAASGPGQKVKLRFRDLTIEADDLQYNLQDGEVRARRAHVKLGKVEGNFDELYFKLASRRGFGVGIVKTRRWETIVPTSAYSGGVGFAFVREKTGGGLELPPIEDKLGIVEIDPNGTRPGLNPIGDRAFEFTDLSESVSSVTAKRATIFPRKLINFQKAELRVTGQKVMSIPLYQLSLTQSQTPIVTEQILNVNDNQLAVNYPYYLSLGSGSSSLLRFRMGQSYGRAQGVNGAGYLDYEVNWNKGDQSQGGVTYSGLGRKDWSLGARHYARLDDRSSFNAQVEMPAGRTVFGSTSYTRSFEGFQTSLSANANRSLRGPKFESTDVSFVAERDPIPVPNLPFNIFLGLTAQDSHLANSAQSLQQTTAGLRVRAQSNPIRLDRQSLFTTSLTANRLIGDVNGLPTTFFATSTLSRVLGPGASALATYDLAIDGFNDALLGRHRLSVQGSYNRGAANLSLFATRSLDIDRQSLYADGSYRLAPLWRLGFNYTLDQYIGSSFRDYRIFLGFRAGFREIGLVYSKQTNRFGIQLLSVPIGY